MDEDRIWENERYQIEQIRELDMEELEIEEVDSDVNYSSPEESRGTGEHGDFTFDTYLPSMHTYLGEVDDTHQRLTFLDGGAILILPMFYLEGVVLFPEATLPLRVIQPRFIAAVERALTQAEASHAIGVIHVRKHSNYERGRFARIGTTAEIRQCRRLEDGSLNVITRGQQRFHLRRCWMDEQGAPCAEVQIIQEDLPLRTPSVAFASLASISRSKLNTLPSRISPKTSHIKRNDYIENDNDNDSDSVSDSSLEDEVSTSNSHIRVYDQGSSDDELAMSPIFQHGESGSNHSRELARRNYQRKNQRKSVGLQAAKCLTPRTLCISEKRLERQEVFNGFKLSRRAPMSFWPQWVYQMYDSYFLAEKLVDMWRQMVGVPNMEALVKSPDLLSFCVASKIPVAEDTRQELLEIDGISYRLRREIQLLECFDKIRCKNCQTLIARRSNMLVMSSEGPLNAYVNPHGYVHEIITVYHAFGLARMSAPEKEHSWFPGYAWTITNCATCEANMGWLFTATNNELKPRYFWGIRSSQVVDDTMKK